MTYHVSDGETWDWSAQREKILVPQTRRVVSQMELTQHETLADIVGLACRLDTINALNRLVQCYVGENKYGCLESSRCTLGWLHC